MAEVVTSNGAGNAADYFPILCWITDYEKRVKKLGGRVDEFLQSLVDEKRAEKEKGHTMIDRLLSLQETQPEYYTDVMILARTDTSAATLEWAMFNFLNHPELLKKAKDRNRRENWFRLVNKGTRHHEASLSPKHSVRDITTILCGSNASPSHGVRRLHGAGYDVLRGTILLVNVWAIHRDPKLWEESEKFKLERFEKEGEDKKLMSFGIGRRVCPGLGLAQQLVTLALDLFVQCFEWEITGKEYVDMRETEKGITMGRAT
ncbi:unnamed protein product [Eruca vesicaria subsp. sativa]|uniref:Cytochrome P450 n=1 Tax=Eruca vesicaria subsp. sativa TaxID=29727 RepID=A0ABC8J2I0_ERUVS|nr:unnamed protein product [Eruca vesicaria subsp. sativa]